jgi:transcriptional regulator with XRE-family HTH domain
MLSGLYERFAGQPGGSRLLAGARLRRRVIVVLHQALEMSHLSQSDLAKKLGIRRSAVNQVFRGDGNVRMETLAEYLHELGFEALLTLTRAGEPRRAALEDRPAAPMTSPANASLAFDLALTGQFLFESRSATRAFGSVAMTAK